MTDEQAIEAMRKFASMVRRSITTTNLDYFKNNSSCKQLDGERNMTVALLVGVKDIDPTKGLEEAREAMSELEKIDDFFAAMRHFSPKKKVKKKKRRKAEATRPERKPKRRKEM